MPDLCRNYVGFMPALCRIDAGFMPDLCRIYAGIMPDLCRNYAGFMPELCRIYAGFMPELCHSDETYEDSEEADGVYLQKLQEGIVDIASIILLNMSQICPINQTNYFNFAEKLIHLDSFMEAANTSKWQDFRHCVQATRKGNFYPSVISYVVDTLWQSFLLGYFGCKEHYNSLLDTWIYLDLFKTLILHPLLQHWNSTPLKLEQNEDGTISLVEESHVVVPKSLKKGTLSQEEISLKLEKCNANLYLKYSVDPKPCFEM
ncbi:unnamed protein product [Orchesella dallaii]|uniref:Uncharacterized protein n=1 Tax=Orchesella dallaii TaxID=48710 RepID=A0ABP1RSR1_9HEXA